MLENDKKLSFYSLDRIFALSFNKISSISAIKMDEFRITILIFVILVLLSICIIF